MEVNELMVPFVLTNEERAFEINRSFGVHLFPDF